MNNIIDVENIMEFFIFKVFEIEMEIFEVKV